MPVKWSTDKPHCTGLWLGWHKSNWEVSILKVTESAMVDYPLNHQICLGCKTVLNVHYDNVDKTQADIEHFSHFSCINSPVSDDNAKRDRRKRRAL